MVPYPPTQEEIIMPAGVPNPGEFVMLNPCSGECHLVQYRENPSRRRRTKKQTVAMAPTPYDDLEVRVAVIRPPSAGKYVDFRIGCSEDIYKLMRHAINEPQECIYVVALNQRHVVLGVVKVSVGGLSKAIIEMRDLLLPLMLLRAATFVVVHNRPSGEPEPSTEDIFMSEQAFKAGEMLGFTLLDSVVIGEGRYVSLRDRGII